MSPPPKTRFDLLDGIRGIAAISVVIYHFSLNQGLHWLDGAWAAVDLFFVLSGFVIAHSYANKIISGMGFVKFTAIRLIRLWPLYLLGLLLGTFAATIVPTELQTVGNIHIFIATLLGLFWIPFFNGYTWPVGSHGVTGTIFPLNDPSWSLFFEMIVNILFFLYLKLWQKTPPIKLLVAFGIAYAALTYYSQTFSQGHSTIGFWFGFPRATIAFFAGAAMYAYRSHLGDLGGRNIDQRNTLSFAIAIMVTGTAIAFFALGGGKTALINSATLIPLAVFLCSNFQLKGRLQNICKAMGDLSYPLYILHFPIFRIFILFAENNTLGPTTNLLIYLAICVAVSYSVVGLDAKVRSALSLKLLTTEHLLRRAV